MCEILYRMLGDQLLRRRDDVTYIFGWQIVYYQSNLPVNILGTEFLWIILMNFFVGPTISKKNPTREQIIAMKHNIIITRIKSAISGVTHQRSENVIKNSVNSVKHS
jgi:hypothetical protein